jgi:hypothetical protein
MYENVCLDNILVRQSKHMGFICNALNCLNEKKKKNKRFLNCLFLSFYLIFFSSSHALCLIVLMKKTKDSQLISFFIFFSFNLLLLSLYIIIYIYIYIYIYI